MEEDILNGNNGIIFDALEEQASFIKVVGVGGGGSNAVNHMYRQGIKGVDFVVCNTDQKSLAQSPVPTKIKLGKGLGAGNNPKVAEAAAREKTDEIRDVISNNTKMIFITAGMGGGTGTGAAPVIAEIAKQIKTEDDMDEILVVAIVTYPYSFEGPRRKKQAEEGIAELRKYVDSILIINNDKLREFGNMKMSEAFAKADDVLLTAAKGIAEIITVEGYVAVDFNDVNTVMANSGTALMGAGIASGEKRAAKAIELASTSVLLNDNDISGAKNILLYFSYGPEREVQMDEIDEVTEYIGKLTGGNSDLIWGMGPDDSLGEELSITLIATGFESKKIEGPKIFKGPEIDDKKPEAPKTNEPKKTDEPYISKPEGVKQFNPEGLYGGHTYNSTPQHIVAQPEQPEQVSQSIQPRGPITHNLDDDPVMYTKQKTNATIAEDASINITIKQPSVQTAPQNVTDTTTQFPNPSIAENNRISISPNSETKTINPIERITQKEVSDRQTRIRQMLEKLRTPQGMTELEATPAVEIYGRDLVDNEDSSVSSIRATINSFGNIVTNTPFLADTPD